MVAVAEAEAVVGVVVAQPVLGEGVGVVVAQPVLGEAVGVVVAQPVLEEVVGVVAGGVAGQVPGWSEPGVVGPGSGEAHGALVHTGVGVDCLVDLEQRECDVLLFCSV